MYVIYLYFMISDNPAGQLESSLLSDLDYNNSQNNMFAHYLPLLVS